MRDLVENIIEKLDYFEIECEELKKDAYDELDRNEFPDNQYLWATIRNMVELLEQYTAQEEGTMNEYKRQELLDLIDELYEDERINLTAYNKLRWAIEEDE